MKQRLMNDVITPVKKIGGKFGKIKNIAELSHFTQWTGWKRQKCIRFIPIINNGEHEITQKVFEISNSGSIPHTSHYIWFELLH